MNELHSQYRTTKKKRVTITTYQHKALVINWYRVFLKYH